MKNINLSEQFNLLIKIDFKSVPAFKKALIRAGYSFTYKETNTDDFLFSIVVTAETATKAVKLHIIYR